MKLRFCRKACLAFILGTLFLFPCFSQNMLMACGEYSFLGPEFWSAGVGFNIRLLNEYIQNDVMVNLGSIQAKDTRIIETRTSETEESIVRTEVVSFPQKFLFSLKDNLYISLDWKWAGLRTGIFASFGVYGLASRAYDLFFNGGAFAGISILPKSLVSVTVDVCPGYAAAFRLGDGVVKNDDGFSLSLSLGIRFNLDKL